MENYIFDVNYIVYCVFVNYIFDKKSHLVFPLVPGDSLFLNLRTCRGRPGDHIAQGKGPKCCWMEIWLKQVRFWLNSDLVVLVLVI